MKPKIAAYALRLPAALKEEAEKLAAGEGSSLNQFIVKAVAEKVASMSGDGAKSSRDHGAEEAELAGVEKREAKREASSPS
jgi:hypothetical protein